jgi:hypothetical protein
MYVFFFPSLFFFCFFLHFLFFVLVWCLLFCFQLVFSFFQCFVFFCIVVILFSVFHKVCAQLHAFPTLLLPLLLLQSQPPSSQPSPQLLLPQPNTFILIPSHFSNPTLLYPSTYHQSPSQFPNPTLLYPSTYPPSSNQPPSPTRPCPICNHPASSCILPYPDCCYQCPASSCSCRLLSRSPPPVQWVFPFFVPFGLLPCGCCSLYSRILWPWGLLRQFDTLEFRPALRVCVLCVVLYLQIRVYNVCYVHG